MTAVMERDGADGVSEDASDASDRPARVRVDWLLAGLLFVGSAAIRLPFQADFLVNFDSVNFAFGVEGFDLERHEPHPPGYLGYVFVARILNFFIDDPNRSLTLLSVLSSGAAAVILYRLCRRYADHVSSVLVASLFSVSALAWYYGIVALSYMPATAITLAMVYACHRARFDRHHWGLYWAAVALAGLGALRQTEMILFLPLLVYSSWTLPWRVRWRAAGIYAALVMAWLIPLLWLSGGLGTYLGVSRDLASLAGGSTAIFSADLAGLMTNFRLVLSGLVTGTLSVLPLFLVGRRAALGRESTRFLLLWTMPALAVFLLIHTGQVGYVLPIVPAVHVVAARILSMWRQDRATQKAKLRPLAVAAGTLLIALSFVVSAAGPRWVVETMRDSGSAGVRDIAVPLVGTFELPAPHRVRAISPSVHDSLWRDVINRVHEEDPDEAVLLARLDGSVRFRPLTYYLQDYVVYTVGRGRESRFGSFFTAHQGQTDYSVEALYRPTPTIDLPESVTQVMIFDLPPERLSTDLPVVWETMTDGTDLATLTVPEGGDLELSTTSDDDTSEDVWIIGLEGTE